MTVGELLDRIDAKEITEWMAYELVTGPLDSKYSDDMLANIHEQLQMLTRFVGAQLEDENGDNPAPAPQRVKRAHELFSPREELDPDATDDPEVFDRNFED